MQQKERAYQTIEEFERKLAEREEELAGLRFRLEEAEATIEAIRTGQIDALVVHGEQGHQLFTLKSADQSYRVFIEKMTEGAVTLNSQGIILYANTQFANMVDLPLSKVIGLSFERFIASENSSQYMQLFTTCWQKDCKGEVYIIAGETKTAVQLSLTTLELQEGLSVSIIITDLSFQKAIREQLQEKNQQLEETNEALETSNHDLQQFASVASHDLQEPLRKIQIFSNLIKDKLDLSGEAAKYVDKIIQSSGRMKTLIIDILNYSRLSASDFPTECIDLSEIAKELMDDFEILIQERGASITIGELPCIEVNKGQVRQVFQNIVSNALKFTRPGIPPVITITSKRLSTRSFDSSEETDGPFCMINFQDNGIGFDEKYLVKVFALFERLNSKDKYEGTGIGMSIAKKIIDKHNGLLTATSNEGSGSQFKIILPVKQSHP